MMDHFVLFGSRRWAGKNCKSIKLGLFKRQQHRLLSDLTTSPTTSRIPETSGITSGNLLRHGPGDAVIVMNVGGKEFCTLRSTVAANEVLAEHVARAEANHEFTHNGNAVFIDRDPAHFQLILNHLRNKVEDSSYYSCNKNEDCSPSKLYSQKHHVQLPKDINALRAIYNEASHYQISELQRASYGRNIFVSIMGALGGGSSNPFDQATQFLHQIRRGLVVIGGLGTVTITSQQDLGNLVGILFPAWFKKEKEQSEEPNQKLADN